MCSFNFGTVTEDMHACNTIGMGYEYNDFGTFQVIKVLFLPTIVTALLPLTVN